jgi:hypothetical protein
MSPSLKSMSLQRRKSSSDVTRHMGLSCPSDLYELPINVVLDDLVQLLPKRLEVARCIL